MERLETIKNSIEKMNKYHQVEILKILDKHKCKLNENKSGVYINMSFLPDEIIEELEKYIEYIHAQESTISNLECQKEEFKNTFFMEKEYKDNMIINE
jgi:hypothetical protein